MKCFVCKNESEFTKLSPEVCTTPNHICYSCGLIFIPGSASLQDYYKKDGYYKKSPNRGLRKEIVSKKLLESLGQERLNTIRSKLEIPFDKKNVLDVGCGYGHLLYAVKKNCGSRVRGVEPSAEIAAVGEKYFDIEITPEVLENFKAEDKYNIILCSHTLEHVDNPISFLKKLKELLAEEGLIYIEVPNVMKPTGGFKLKNFFYSEHLQTFSERNLEILLNRCGLEVVAYNSDDFLYFLVQKSESPITKTKSIRSDDILKFLDQYDQNYSILDTLRVYFNKFKYLLRVIRHKLF